MAGDIGTRSKKGTTVAARVAMDTQLHPRASDLVTLLDGFLAGLQSGPPVPDFNPDPTRDSDDYQIGLAMGESIGHFMASRGMSQADWQKMVPDGLPEGGGFLDDIGLGGVGEVLEGIGGGFLGNLAGSALEAGTLGIVGGDDALLDVVPGEQGGLSLF